jgi:hypothetical protein
MIKLGISLAAFGLVACGGGSNNGASASTGGQTSIVGAEVQGVWIQKSEAEELRTTHKIESLCEEVRKDPNVKIMNVRLIDSSGVTYIYDPQAGKIEELNMGTLAPSGIFTPSKLTKDMIGDATVKITAKNNVLTFTAGGLSMEYLRSSDGEARQYYAAQEACKR